MKISLEKKLQKALAKGDSEAIRECCGEVYLQYERLLFFIAMRILANPEEAKDATSEAFLSFMSNLDSIRIKSIKYYLVQSVDRIAKRRMYQSSNQDDFEESNCAEQSVASMAIKMDASTALSVLDEEEKSIVIYKLEYGYRFKEIGKMLGMSENAASSKYTRSLRKMKRRLEDKYEEKEN